MIQFPEHKCGLHLTHNQHKDFYETIQKYIDDHELFDAFSDWTARQKAIDTDSLWVLQWYPETPIGSKTVAASTFEEVMRLANE